MGVRLPTILGKGIDDVWKTLNQEYDEERVVDLINCIHRLDDLMADLQQNSKLRPIKDDGAGDIALWNKVSYLAQSDSKDAVDISGNCQVLPRKGLHERPMALCRSLQVPTTEGVFLFVKVLGRLW